MRDEAGRTRRRQEVSATVSTATRPCPRCGAANEPAADFCVNCGDYLQWAGENHHEPAPAATVPSRPEPAAGPASPAPPRGGQHRRADAEPSGPTSTATERTGEPADPGARVAGRPPAPARHRPPAESVAIPTARRIPTVVKDLGPRSGLVPREPPADGTRRRRFKEPASVAPTGSGMRRPLASAGSAGPCRSCGTSTPPGRRYCRCGAPLAPMEPPAEPPRVAPAPIRGRRAFDRAMRAAGRGGRPRWDRPVAGRVRAVRTVVAAALVGLLVLAFTGPGVRARTLLAAGGGALLPYAYQAIQVQDAELSTPGAAVDGYAPANAVDGSSSLSWAIAWTPAPAPARCGESSTPALVIRFARAGDITRVLVNPGLDPTDANRSRQVVPRALDIRSTDGRCARIDLAADGGPQEFPVDLPDASQVSVQIVDAAPPGADAPADGLLAGLSEIRFYAG